MYDLGLIGNCQSLALVSPQGSIPWLCWPRPDSPPIFGHILDADGGVFSICPAGETHSATQRYIPNTNIIESTITSDDGSYTITDLLPRFEQHGRTYRPLTLIRIVRRVTGQPQITVRCRPVQGWTKTPAPVMRGNSHVRFQGYSDELRLTTNLPLTYLLEEQSTSLMGTLYFALTWGVPVEGDLGQACEDFLHRTTDHWRNWVRSTTIPVHYQREAIRSALVLKLHCFEETGAVLAAATSSLPEEPGGVRNWDYRFCWLRDAFFTVGALYRLGHSSELEGILGFLLDVAQRGKDNILHPVYRLDGTLPLPELEHPEWAGSSGSKPVRSGNQAAEHVQNDVYGEMLLVLAALYQDERFAHLRGPDWESLLITLAGRCRDCLAEPDAGLWELRGGWKPHAFSTLLCWAGLDRFAELAERGQVAVDAAPWRLAAAAADHQLRLSVQHGVLFNAPGEDVTDASLALLPLLRHPDRELSRRTVATIVDQLSVREDGQATGFFYRYRYRDDFGLPESAFVVCSFWVAEALAKLGQTDEAENILKRSLSAANGLGLFAEHYNPGECRQTGNFPQCYSHVGLIHAAFAISPAWPSVI